MTLIVALLAAVLLQFAAGELHSVQRGRRAPHPRYLDARPLLYAASLLLLVLVAVLAVLVALADEGIGSLAYQARMRRLGVYTFSGMLAACAVAHALHLMARPREMRVSSNSVWIAVLWVAAFGAGVCYIAAGDAFW